MKEHYTFDELVDIIAMLRSENGCPWDRKQTHASLLKYLVEESYEFIDAFEHGNPDQMADELGDVLLQVLLHAEIGKEQGTFSMEDVIDHIAKKMIVRHPHVFSDAVAEDAEEVLKNWEQIKYDNGEKKTPLQILKSITKSYSSVLRAQKIVEKLKKLRNIENFEQETIDKMDEILDNRSRCTVSCTPEIQVGAELFAVICKAEKQKLSADMCLNQYLDKLIEAFEDSLPNHMKM